MSCSCPERSDHVEVSEIGQSQLVVLDRVRIIDEMVIHWWMTESWLDMRIGHMEFCSSHSLTPGATALDSISMGVLL